MSINDTKRINFLQDSLETILKGDLNFVNIIKLAKKSKIKGFTNTNIRDIFKSKGYEYNKVSNKWVKILVEKSVGLPPVIIPITEDIVQKSVGLTPEIIPITEDIVQMSVGLTPEVIPITEDIVQMSVGLTPEVIPITEDIVQMSVGLTPEIIPITEDIVQMSVGLTPEVIPITEDIVQMSVGRVPPVTEKILRTYTPNTSIIVQEVLKLSCSKSKRYDLTLSEDLVNKAIEKLKNKHSLETEALIKPSKLFENILFDYIYSSI